MSLLPGNRDTSTPAPGDVSRLTSPPAGSDPWQTTVGASTAGAAAGVIVSYGLGLALGHPIPVEIAGAISVLGTFGFGKVFPRP